MKVRPSRSTRKLPIRWLVLAVIIAAATLVLLLVLIATRTASKDNLLSPVVSKVVRETKPIAAEVKPGLPKQLIISSININAPIDYVGLTPDGAMGIKANPEIVGWYMLGPRPGDKGNAVIAGHFGWQENGKSAIFNDIQKLNKGDELSVVDQEGQSVTFVVREIRKYNPDADATVVFQSSDDGSHLNLITCNGVWVKDKQSYSDRLVVFTDKK
jgi:sortase A